MIIFNMVVLLTVLLVIQPISKVFFFARILVMVALVVNSVELHNLNFHN